MVIFNANNFGDFIVPPHSAGELYVSDDGAALPDNLATNDIIKIGHLPADCMPVDLIIHTEELDSHGTDTLRFSVGLLNDAGDDIVSGSELLAGAKAEVLKTIRGDGAGFLGITRDKEKDRVIAVKVTADPATGAAGKLRVIMTYRASNGGA